MNPISPDRLTRAERLDEVARFLALAILRRQARTQGDRVAGRAAPLPNAASASESSASGLDSGAKMRLTVSPKGAGR